MPAAVVSRATSSSAPTLYADIEPVRICVTQFNRPLRDIQLLAGNLVQKLKEFGARQVKQFGLEDHVISLFVPACIGILHSVATCGLPPGEIARSGLQKEAGKPG